MPRPLGLRFSPPPTAISPELEWLLRAAFAGAEMSPPPGCDRQKVARLAELFDLGPRLVASRGATAVRRGLGPAAELLVHKHRRAVAAALAIDGLAAELTAAAAPSRTPIVFLKGYAINHILDAAPGLRPYADLDVLVPATEAQALAAALVDRGFRVLPVRANEQHLAPLVSPMGIAIDLHFRLRGVSLGDGWATTEDLLEAELCRRLAGHRGSAWAPVPRLLAAHALVHGIEQHGYRPAGYPLLRMVADLLALLPEPDRRREELGAAADWIAGTVSAAETAAALRLARHLAAGRIPEAGRDPDAAALLHHIVAGTMSSRYRASLRLTHTAARLRLALSEGHLLGYISRKLSPRAAVPPASPRR